MIYMSPIKSLGTSEQQYCLIVHPISNCGHVRNQMRTASTRLLVMNLTINRTGLVMCVPILVVVYLCLSLCTNVCLCEHVCLCVQLFVFVNMFVIVNQYLPIGSLPAREYLVREIST